MKQVFFSILIIAFVSNSCGQSQSPALTKTAMLTDYDSLCSALREAHGGLYRFHTKEQINKHFSAYRSRISDVQTKYQFISLLSEMLAKIGDGHMRLEYDVETAGALSKARMFPLRLYIEGNKLLVLYNDSPADTTIQPGMEILEVNGHSSSQLVPTLLAKISGDGFIETGKRRRLERGFAIGYWLFIEQTDNFTIKVKDLSGKTKLVKLPGVFTAQREANRARNPVNEIVRTQLGKLDGSKDNISIRFVNDSVAAIRVRNFTESNFLTSLDNVFQQAAKAKVLILDIRGNGGGTDMWGAYLVSKCMGKPFRYFDHIYVPTITPSFTSFKQQSLDDLKNHTIANPGGGFLVTAKLHSGVGEQLPSATPFTGKLLVLTDGNTFSTAADVAAQLRNRPHTFFIGEETGGGYQGNTSGLNAQLKLPNSGCGLRIQMYDYWNSVPAPREKGRGILPDYPVENKIAELMQGIDAQWNKAVMLAVGK